MSLLKRTEASKKPSTTTMFQINLMVRMVLNNYIIRAVKLYGGLGQGKAFLATKAGSPTNQRCVSIDTICSMLDKGLLTKVETAFYVEYRLTEKARKIVAECVKPNT